MSLSEQDLELLEAYTDGELTTAEEDALRERLSAEPELAAAMAAVRAERNLRLAIWKSYEPDEAAVQRLVSRVDAAVDRNTMWAHRMGSFRRWSAAAACILIGIMIGRVGNNSGGGLYPTVPVGQVTPVSSPIEYPIVNDYGHAVGVQRFNSAKEANEFFEELARWQKAREQIRNGQMMMPMTERF
jgi:hypothetical protein